MIDFNLSSNVEVAVQFFVRTAEIAAGIILANYILAQLFVYQLR